MNRYTAIIALMLLTPLVVLGGNVAPCSAGAVGENVLPVTNGITTYCVSDYGWSDTWLVGSPSTYHQYVDMLSGDDALNLLYNTPANGVGSGLGWLSPSLDAGTLSATSVQSRYSVVTALHMTGAGSSESVIQNTDGLRVTIDT